MFYYSPNDTTNKAMSYTPTPSSLSSTTTPTSSRNNSIASMGTSSEPRPIAMGFTLSSSGSNSADTHDIFHARSNSYASTSRCAYPSWPTGAALVRNPSTSSNASFAASSTPSAYISDEDLFGEDDCSAYLSEAPAPPRSAEVWLAQPLLPPVVEFNHRSTAATAAAAAPMAPRRSSVHFSSKSKKSRGASGNKRKE